MNVSFQQIDTRSELLERLGRQQRSVLLGDDDEAPREFYVGGSPACTIGVCSQGLGVKPFSVVDEVAEEIWVGYNSKVANVDMLKCQTRFVVRLDCVFYTFLEAVRGDSVIVIYELGACRISRSGKVLWNHPTDLVLEYRDGGNVLYLRTSDGVMTIEKRQGVLQR